MTGLPNRKVTKKEVDVLRRSNKISEVDSGHRYSGTAESGLFSRLEITLQGGKKEELIYFGENGRWEVVEDTSPCDTGLWKCDACREEIWGERAEPPLYHIRSCREATPNSLSFCEE